MPTFLDRFGASLGNSNTGKKGFVVSILELGAWFGALINGHVSDRISRKHSIQVAVVVFCLGSALQAGAMNVNYLFFGRVFAGIGIGMLSMVVPMYQAEISPPEIRGSLVALQQFAITIGILISFWIDYGTAYINGEAQWRIPLALQLIPALILGIGITFFPYSPRWLSAQGRDQEALETLAKLRRKPIDDPTVVIESKEIRAEVLFEKEISKEMYPALQNGTFTSNLKLELKGYASLFTPGLFPRLAIGCLINAFQQFTGINAIIYYAPTIFAQLGQTGNSQQLLGTGVVGIINVIFTIPAVLFYDQLGRRKMLLMGATGMIISHVIVAALVGVYGDVWSTHKQAGIAAAAFIYVFILNFAYSWGPAGWVIPAEIMPMRVRAKGISITTSANWFTNFIIALITPVMIQNITYGTYIFFAICTTLAWLFVYFFLPETKGKTLEEMDSVFGDDSAIRDAEKMSRINERLGLPNKHSSRESNSESNSAELKTEVKKDEVINK